MAKKKKETEVKVTKGKNLAYGNMLRIEFDDGCKIYFSKKGISVVVPKKSKVWKDNVKARNRENFEMLFTPKEVECLLNSLEWWLK